MARSSRRLGTTKPAGCGGVCPLDVALLALTVGYPGLAIGATLCAIAWHRHRAWGALIGAVAGFALWLGGTHRA